MAALDLWLKPFTMPDTTQRSPLVQRVPAVRPVGGGWSMPDDFESDGYWEAVHVVYSHILIWLINERPQGVRLYRSAGNWVVRDVQTAQEFSRPTLAEALTLAAHTLCDSVGA